MMVGADQPPSAPFAAGNDRAAMAADIREGTYSSVLAMDDDHGLVADLKRQIVADLRELFRAADANPLLQEKALSFEREHRWVGIEAARHRPGAVVALVLAALKSFAELQHHIFGH